MNKDNHLAFIMACVVLYLVTDSFGEYLLYTGAAIVLTVILNATHLYRYVYPNRKGCGVRLFKPNDQWRSWCNKHQQCERCDPRNGRKIPR